MCLRVKEGALFISDAHDSDKRDGFYRFLLKIKEKEINPTQLFLMGDMFDLLVGEVKYLVKTHAKEIELLDEIAKNLEVYYFEGNHDFVLKKVFKNVKVIDIGMQPLLFDIADKKILLSHGDKYGGALHAFFTKLIRSVFLLKILNLIDRIGDFFISKKIKSDLLKKNICSKIKNFEKLIESKISKNHLFEADIIAEGHYHQNRNFENKKYKYINFSSFACNQSYFIVQLSPEIKFLEIKGDA